MENREELDSFEAAKKWSALIALDATKHEQSTITILSKALHEWIALQATNDQLKSPMAGLIVGLDEPTTAWVATLEDYASSLIGAAYLGYWIALNGTDHPDLDLLEVLKQVNEHVANCPICQGREEENKMQSLVDTIFSQEHKPEG